MLSSFYLTPLLVTATLLHSYFFSSLAEERLLAQTVIARDALLCHCEEPRLIGATKQSPGLPRFARNDKRGGAQSDTPPGRCEAGEASRSNLGGGNEIAALRSQ